MSKGIYGGLDYLPSRYHAWIREPGRTVVLAKKNGAVVRTLRAEGPLPQPSPAPGRGLGPRLPPAQVQLWGPRSGYCYGACGDSGPCSRGKVPAWRGHWLWRAIALSREPAGIVRQGASGCHIRSPLPPPHGQPCRRDRTGHCQLKWGFPEQPRSLHRAGTALFPVGPAAATQRPGWGSFEPAAMGVCQDAGAPFPSSGTNSCQTPT